jgi:hypothetical protein
MTATVLDRWLERWDDGQQLVGPTHRQRSYRPGTGPNTALSRGNESRPAFATRKTGEQRLAAQRPSMPDSPWSSLVPGPGAFAAPLGPRRSECRFSHDLPTLITSEPAGCACPRKPTGPGGDLTPPGPVNQPSRQHDLSRRPAVAPHPAEPSPRCRRPLTPGGVSPSHSFLSLIVLRLVGLAESALHPRGTPACAKGMLQEMRRPQ